VALTVLAGGAYFDTNHVASAINASHKWKELTLDPTGSRFVCGSKPSCGQMIAATTLADDHYQPPCLQICLTWKNWRYQKNKAIFWGLCKEYPNNIWPYMVRMGPPSYKFVFVTPSYPIISHLNIVKSIIHHCYCLVGGLEHFLFFHIIIGSNDPNWLSYFSEG